VLQADAEAGPFARVRAQKLNRSWKTLQDALDELGLHAWDLCTTIDSATREQGGPGEYYCEGFILKRVADVVGDRGLAPDPRQEARVR
jgi:hypothetical protein